MRKYVGLNKAYKHFNVPFAVVIHPQRPCATDILEWETSLSRDLITTMAIIGKPVSDNGSGLAKEIGPILVGIKFQNTFHTTELILMLLKMLSA